MSETYNEKKPGVSFNTQHKQANERQVGGSHYGSSIQHWDMVIANDLNYFEGQITKYVMRCRKKNGLQDLQKAMHFLEKYIEEWPNIAEKLPAAQIVVHDVDEEYRQQVAAAASFENDGFFHDGTAGYQCIHCRLVTRAKSPLSAARKHQCLAYQPTGASAPTPV